MRLPIHQIDAFTDRVFAGNPAAVCPLASWLPDETLQAIALENNLSETAFLVASDSGYELRWFTPKMEVDLCGHATLAAAWVVFHRYHEDWSEVRFETKSGELAVTRRGESLVMDFPSQPGEPCDPPEGLVDALGGTPTEIQKSVHYYLVSYGSENDVRKLEPRAAGLMQLDKIGVIATAPGEGGVDFVSRFFAPQAGVLEDPVTGSAHCVLTPYWAERLGRTLLKARQISERGGELECELRDDRIHITGRAALYLEGEIRVG